MSGEEENNLSTIWLLLEHVQHGSGQLISDNLSGCCLQGRLEGFSVSNSGVDHMSAYMLINAKLFIPEERGREREERGVKKEPELLPCSRSCSQLFQVAHGVRAYLCYNFRLSERESERERGDRVATLRRLLL